MRSILGADVIAAALGRFAPTAEQAAVIEAPLEPALVVAGAGSGKTETMAGRVVWLVANGLVRRDEILGLTFTRKAAGELAERIHTRLDRLFELQRRGLVPHLARLHAAGALSVLATPEAASPPRRAEILDGLAASVGAEPVPDAQDEILLRPEVATYNSFADRIVREHGLRIGRDAGSAMLSESAAWLLMRRVVFSSDDPELEERPEAPRTIIDAALRIARDGLDNLADLDRLAAFPAAFSRVLDLPSDSARVTVYSDVAQAERKVAALGMLTRLAAEYARQKTRLGVMDFADQVAGALEIVSRHPAVADDLRGQFRVVLLDEYQDTSVLQTDLLARIFAGTGVMAVGDPHQSIYGWRGASAGNLGNFEVAFAGSASTHRYALLTSWRNSAGILDAANAVLRPLASRAPVAVPELRPRPAAPAGRVEVAFDRALDDEADRVARWFVGVRAERAVAGQATTGAVLFRSKKHMVRFGEALGRHGVPHRILGLGGLLMTPEVVDVVAALRVISDPDAGSSLIRLLAGPRWGVGLADLRRLRELATRIASHDESLAPLDAEVIARVRASPVADRASIVDALDFVTRQPDRHSWLADFTPAARERLREAGGVFASLRRSAGMPIPEIIRAIEIELRLDVELASNESRGPARIATAQLRAFVDEIQGFLAADETGSIGSLLAWLDHAEQLDEFMPRTEPPDDDVVQLLTIHGSKGLEWDAVAVPRLVMDELPTMARDTRGWLAFGVLPYDFRGDADWLPRLAWRDVGTQQEMRDAMGRFVDDHRQRQLDEDRRLAYVAMTRARDRLLLSGSSWAGTKKPRVPSVFLGEAAAAIGAPLAPADAGDDPYAGERRLLSWPMDPLGGRRPIVSRAAAAVDTAIVSGAGEPDAQTAMLLAERAARADAGRRAAPIRIPASQYKDFLADYDAAVDRIARPLPERPYRQTRVGTLFHAWVEQRSGLVGDGEGTDDVLWDDDLVLDDGTETDELNRLKAAFERSEWARRQPIAVETQIDYPAVGLDGRTHLVICKLDAVYERDGRIEIVDWKTGKPPASEEERRDRLVQLELYREAYHRKHGVARDAIDVALVYVGSDVTVRG